MSVRLKTVLALAAILGGCATVQQPAPAPAPAPVVRTENPAIASLMDGARTDATAGRLSNAAASLGLGKLAPTFGFGSLRSPVVLAEGAGVEGAEAFAPHCN